MVLLNVFWSADIHSGFINCLGNGACKRITSCAHYATADIKAQTQIKT